MFKRRARKYFKQDQENVQSKIENILDQDQENVQNRTKIKMKKMWMKSRTNLARITRFC